MREKIFTSVQDDKLFKVILSGSEESVFSWHISSRPKMIHALCVTRLDTLDRRRL